MMHCMHARTCAQSDDGSGGDGDGGGEAVVAEEDDDEILEEITNAKRPAVGKEHASHTSSPRLP